jgi:hypothetical protein
MTTVRVFSLQLFWKGEPQMRRLLEMPTESGGTVLIQVAPIDGEERLVGRADIIEKTTKTLEEVFAQVRPVALAARDVIEDVCPDEFSVEFGVAVTLEGNAIFASTSAETTFTVSVTWKPHSSLKKND